MIFIVALTAPLTAALGALLVVPLDALPVAPQYVVLRLASGFPVAPLCVVLRPAFGFSV